MSEQDRKEDVKQVLKARCPTVLLPWPSADSSQDALAEAYRRHAGAVFGLARRLLTDHARAEEIVQEGICALVERA